MSKLADFVGLIQDKLDEFVDLYEDAVAKNDPETAEAEYKRGFRNGTLSAELDKAIAYQNGSDEGYRDGYAMGVADTENKYRDSKPEEQSNSRDNEAESTGPTIQDWAKRIGESMPPLSGSTDAWLGGILRNL